MTSIRIHDNAKADLRRLDRKAAGSAAMLMSQMERDSNLQDALLIHDESIELRDMSIHVSKWLSQYHGPNKRNLWRLKPLEVVDGGGFWFRIIYAYYPPHGRSGNEIWVLAVVHRNEFNYGELNNELEARIIRDYDELS